MKQVLIEIKGTQQYAQADSDVTTFTTVGTLEQADDMLTLSYLESEMIGAKGVKTNLIIENGKKMTLVRSGGMESRMTVEKGRRHSCLYNTPQGDFVLGVYGDEVIAEIGETQGKLYLSYTLDINSGLLSKNIMEIKIKEIKG